MVDTTRSLRVNPRPSSKMAALLEEGRRKGLHSIVKRTSTHSFRSNRKRPYCVFDGVELVSKRKRIAPQSSASAPASANHASIHAPGSLPGTSYAAAPPFVAPGRRASSASAATPPSASTRTSVSMTYTAHPSILRMRELAPAPSNQTSGARPRDSAVPARQNKGKRRAGGRAEDGAAIYPDAGTSRGPANGRHVAGAPPLSGSAGRRNSRAKRSTQISDALDDTPPPGLTVPQGGIPVPIDLNGLRVPSELQPLIDVVRRVLESEVELRQRAEARCAEEVQRRAAAEHLAEELRAANARLVDEARAWMQIAANPLASLSAPAQLSSGATYNGRAGLPSYGGAGHPGENAFRSVSRSGTPVPLQQNGAVTHADRKGKGRMVVPDGDVDPPPSAHEDQIMQYAAAVQQFLGCADSGAPP
ncbi:hypothetical protein WOLCODRAFT_135175 [Wolfiporia cocos MD-104 SS10]|uniref:Uncharacterized protein n=1 Tax=Wolfiporia cocos (strain MD-104) TaxID=742152 RepID=A0A2H3JC48_WOLCO|nr:hypothetical protein WOLCODRAFT_135175 [Wolfiporia cocos MD-104 SS10]